MISESITTNAVEPPTSEELDLMAALEAGYQHKRPVFKLEAAGLAPTYEAAESEAAAVRAAEARGWGDLDRAVTVTLIERYDDAEAAVVNITGGTPLPPKLGRDAA